MEKPMSEKVRNGIRPCARVCRNRRFQILNIIEELESGELTLTDLEKYYVDFTSQIESKRSQWDPFIFTYGLLIDDENNPIQGNIGEGGLQNAREKLVAICFNGWTCLQNRNGSSTT